MNILQDQVNEAKSLSVTFFVRMVEQLEGEFVNMLRLLTDRFK